ncbi:MAG: TonB-dependent receptor [Aquabacterium sp.]|nr:TonB-dependent receptor [Ferruginibacter sp.]
MKKLLRKFYYLSPGTAKSITSFVVRNSLFFLLMLLSCFNSNAQNKIRVSGTVKDEKGIPAANASVTVKGALTGSTTDANGVFSIDVPNQKSVLVISYLGYQTKETTVGNQTNIPIGLVAASNQLNEVIVVGYGSQKKATLTGSVSTIKGSEIVKSPTTNVSNSLVGRVPGLTAIQGSGEPGYDGSTLRIRGVNSLGNNDVLVVVDGIAGRSLERIDPNSIESITILKDASAAIYGAQAANGVILITTKRGKMGKPEITFNINYGYNQPTKNPKMADAATYATMLNEIATYNGSPAKYTPAEITKFADGSDLWRYPNTDWFKATLKSKSKQTSYNTTISGGAENLRYFISLGAKTQEGNYYRSATKYNQYDLRTNIDGKISKDISLTFDVAGRMEDKNYPVRGSGSIFRMVMRGKPTLPAYWPDGTPGPDIEYGDNPVVVSTNATGYDKDKYYTVNTNLKLNINIPWVKGLSLTGTAAIDKGFDFRKTWQTPWYLYTANFNVLDANGNPKLTKGKRGFDDARLNEASRDELTKTFYGLVNYETKIAQKHNIKLLVGSELRKGNSEYFNAFRRFFASTAIDQLFAGGAAEINNSGSGTIASRLNYFGRVNYGFKDKYLAEFVWRYDGSYNFPSNHRWGFFPGISAGWVVSEEGFFRNNVNFVDRLKIRGSIGQTGNDRVQYGPNGTPVEFQYLSTFGYGNILGSPYLPFVTNGTTENQTLIETRLANPNITWEVADQANIGFEASLLKNKLSIEFDYFSYKRSSVLARRNASVPTSTGITLSAENLGKVKNTGFDFTVGYRNSIRDFNYSVSLNGGYAKNKIVFWDEAPGAPDYKQSTGHSMNTGTYYQAIGIFADQGAVDKYPHWTGARAGDVIFKDVNADGVIDAKDQVRSDKSNVPTFTAGVNLYVQYKGFDLSVLAQGATGAVNYINTESGEIGNYLQSFADGRWTVNNTTSSKPRTFNRGNEYWVGNANTYFLKKTDYLRLKNLQFGYSLPKKLTDKVGIQVFRVFVSGYNLLTYSPDYKDFDPEASAGNGQSYPLQRVLSAGLTLTF